MTQLNLPRQKSGEQTLPVLNETMPLLPLSEASSSGASSSGASSSEASSSEASSPEATSSEAAAPGAWQYGVSGGDTRREEDGMAALPVVNPDAPVTPSPVAAAVEIPQAAETAEAEEPSRVPTAVATVTEDSVKVFRDDESTELIRGRGRAAGHLPVATASPVDGVGMLVPPEGNGEYLTAGQVEKLLHAAYMRGRNEAVAAKIEGDTSIRTLPRHGDVLFSTRPSVWERNPVA